MVVNCDEVWREVSNYLDGEVNPELRAAIATHVQGCKRCTAVVDGARNLVRVFADDRVLEVPAGYSQRLHRRLAEVMPRPRGTAYPWLMSLAAALLLAGGVVLANAAGSQVAKKSLHAKMGQEVPADMQVIVSADGRSFHVAGCTFIHEKDNLRTMTAKEAMQEGYVPCVRCMRKYLERASVERQAQPPWQIAAMSW